MYVKWCPYPETEKKSDNARLRTEKLIQNIKMNGTWVKNEEMSVI